MRLPKHVELKGTFERMMGSQVNGVDGVIRLVSGTPKTRVAISSQTHPDEPEGLAAQQFLLDNHGLLKNVEILLVVHNVLGTVKYFEGDPKARGAGGLNWNRLPKDR